MPRTGTFFDNNTVPAVYLNQINSDYYIGLRLKYLLVHSKPLFFYHCEKCGGGGGCTCGN